MTITRYRTADYGKSAAPDGELVLYTDYAALEAEVERLREALRQICGCDEDCTEADMDIYPAEIKGYNDERDYEQRDGFKNGWNAAVIEFCTKVSGIACIALSADTPHG